jgi:hypothetical protein
MWPQFQRMYPICCHTFFFACPAFWKSPFEAWRRVRYWNVIRRSSEKTAYFTFIQTPPFSAPHPLSETLFAKLIGNVTPRPVVRGRTRKPSLLLIRTPDISVNRVTTLQQNTTPYSTAYSIRISHPSKYAFPPIVSRLTRK